MTPRALVALPLLLALDLPACPHVRPTPAPPPPVVVAVPGPGEAAVVARSYVTTICAGSMCWSHEGRGYADARPARDLDWESEAPSRRWEDEPVEWPPLPPQPKEPEGPTEERFSGEVVLRDAKGDETRVSVDEETYQRAQLKTRWRVDSRTGKLAKVKPGFNEVPK